MNRKNKRPSPLTMASNAKWRYGLPSDVRELINSSTPRRDFKLKNFDYPVLAKTQQNLLLKNMGVVL